MAKYRQIQTKFWLDPFIEDLTPEQKYFYAYLLTNPSSKQCGIYEITLRKISYETGYNVETVEKLITFFTEKNKIVYSKETSEICIINFQKHNNTKSPKLQACINRELSEVKNTLLIGYIYTMHTKTQEEEEEEEEEEEKKEEKEKEEKTILSNFDKLDLTSFKNPDSYNQEEKIELKTAISAELKNSDQWIEDTARATALEIYAVNEQIQCFVNEITARDDIYKPIREIKSHCVNWIKKQNITSNGNNPRKNDPTIAQKKGGYGKL